MTAGTITPPTAAAIGTAARRGSLRSPATNSRLSSRPATKKKIASSPSAAQVARERSRCRAAGPIVKARRASYPLAHGEFAHTSATTAPTMSSAPPMVS